MNVSDMQRTSRSGAVRSHTATTRLSGRRLIMARVAWLVLVVPSLGLFVASLPAYYAQIQRACVDLVTCNLTGALTAKGLQELPALGLSVSGYAALLTIFFTIIVAIWSGIGFLIFWRRSDEWFVPRWMGLFLLLGMIGAVSTVLPPTSRFNSNNLPWWLGLVTPVVYVTIIFSQIYRYRRVSTRVERQQTRWVVFGIIVVLTGIFVILPMFTFIFPTLNQPNIPSSVFSA
jgi:hypothetical protein